MEGAFPGLRSALAQHGALGISWPKRSSRLPTDLDQKSVRALGLAAGLVTVKLTAVDETWPEFKFV